uniref:subtilase family N-terminal domain-containing protein n=1 Tax=Porphyromonas cangingivalis TaxID=36874 RepID=UPI00242D24AD
MKKLIIPILSALVSLSACQDHNLLEETYSKEANNNPLRTLENESYNNLSTPGIVYIKMDASSAERLKASGEISIRALSSLNTEIETASRRLGVKSIERLFPESKEYMQRHKAYGLDRWYIVRYEEENTVSQAIRTLSAIDEFEVVEPCYQIERDGRQIGQAFADTKYPIITTSGEASFKFNDPSFGEQWHYHNTGATSWAVAGADINLLKAWETETGKPNVIIAVIDDGVDVTHEDLKENLWINP